MTDGNKNRRATVRKVQVGVVLCQFAFNSLEYADRSVLWSVVSRIFT